MKYRITHTTLYKTATRVSVCHNMAWLTPRTTFRQQVESHEIKVEPPPSTWDVRRDTFGNEVTHFSLNEGYKSLEVVSTSDVTVAPPIVLPEKSPTWETIVDGMQAHATPDDLDAFQYCFDSPRSYRFEEAAAFAQKSFSPCRPIVDALLDLTGRVHSQFTFDNRATTVTTPVSRVLKERRGVCQDFAHVQVAMLRSLGLAARYVSGYIRTDPPPGQSRLVGADASHAWVSAWCGELGWLDFDPTNNTPAGQDHILVAWGRDYGDVAPLKGVYTGGGKHTLDVSVDVAPVEVATTSNELQE